MKSILLLVVIVLLATIPSAFAVEDGAILVSDNDADLSVGTVISDTLGYPLFVTEWGEYDSEVIGAISKDSLSKLVIIGGPMAVPEQYEKELSGVSMSIERHSGETRQQTSIAIYEKFQDELVESGVKMAVMDGSKPVTMKGAIPVYIHDNADEIKEIVEKNRDNALLADQEVVLNLVEEVDVETEVFSIDDDFVESTSREIQAIKETIMIEKKLAIEKLGELVDERPELVKRVEANIGKRMEILGKKAEAIAVETKTAISKKAAEIAEEAADSAIETAKDSVMDKISSIVTKEPEDVGETPVDAITVKTLETPEKEEESGTVDETTASTGGAILCDPSTQCSDGSACILLPDKGFACVSEEYAEDPCSFYECPEDTVCSVIDADVRQVNCLLESEATGATSQ